MVSGCPKPFCHRNKSALKHNRAGLDTKFGFLLARFELPLLRFGLRRLFVFLLVRIFLLFLLLLLLRLYFGRRRLMRRRRWPLRRFLNCGWPLGRHGLRFWRWSWARLIVRAFRRLRGGSRLSPRRRRSICGRRGRGLG